MASNRAKAWIQRRIIHLVGRADSMRLWPVVVAEVGAEVGAEVVEVMA